MPGFGAHRDGFPNARLIRSETGVQSETDPALGRSINRNSSGRIVPTNADIPELDVSFVGECDEEPGPVDAKGLGELTAVSAAPPIANAVYHAGGKRIRDLPITDEKLL